MRDLEEACHFSDVCYKEVNACFATIFSACVVTSYSSDNCFCDISSVVLDLVQASRF